MNRKPSTSPVFLLKKYAKIPWSLNSLEKYYIMGKGKWRRRPLTIEGQQLNMSKILDNIIELMPKRP